MAIEWRKYGEEKPEKGSYCFVRVITGRIYSFSYIGSGKWNGILASEDHLWIYQNELAATAAPGAKLYTGEEMNQAEYNAYHAGRDSLLSPSDFID